MLNLIPSDTAQQQQHTVREHGAVSVQTAVVELTNTSHIWIACLWHKLASFLHYHLVLFNDREARRGVIQNTSYG